MDPLNCEATFRIALLPDNQITAVPRLSAVAFVFDIPGVGRQLEALEVGGKMYRCHEQPNSLLKTLPASLGKLGALKQLTLAGLDGLEELPDAVVGLTSLGSLTIQDCDKLMALPRGIGKLGALKQLTIVGLYELQEMPDLIGQADCAVQLDD